MTNLTLSEKLLLLALDDEKGEILFNASTSLDYALLGAVLMEFSEQGYFRMEEGKLRLLKTAPPATEAQQLVFGKILELKKPKSIKAMIERFSMFSSLPSELRKALLKGLITKGIIKEENKKILWIFNRSVYPEANGQAEKALRQQLKQILLEGKEPNYQEVILLGLVKACHLLKELVPDKALRKKAKANIETLLEQYEYGDEIGRAVREIEKAIMLTLTTSTMAVISVS